MILNRPRTFLGAQTPQIDVPQVASIARPHGRDVRSGLGLSSGYTTHLTTLFYTPSGDLPMGVRLWSALARPRFIHACVEVDGVILFDQPYAAPGGWYESSSHRRSRPPAATIDLPARVPFRDVESAGRMVEGRYTQRVRSAANVVTGSPVWPRNCTTTASELLWHLGVWAPATTPDQLWSELCRIVGGIGRDSSMRIARPIR